MAGNVILLRRILWILSNNTLR